jgi:hypothetical protein
MGEPSSREDIGASNLQIKAADVPSKKKEDRPTGTL